jgi:hypothetical protein
MQNRFLTVFPVFLFCIMFLLALTGNDNPSITDKEILKNSGKLQQIPYQYIPLKDTIYILGDCYIELNLKKQTASLISRNDSTKTFKVSSGNSGIKKGKDTPEGIFTVQSKHEEAISKQFNNAKMFHWIGFNGNIAFHGLEGNGYYWNLGKRPSSHGCVRMKREDVEEFYNKVHLGTPVIVFSGEPARIYAFGSWKDYRPNYDIILKEFDRQEIKIMSRRLKYLYKGLAHINNYNRVFLDGTTPLRNGGFEIGDPLLIPRVQKSYIWDRTIDYAKQDRLCFLDEKLHLVGSRIKLPKASTH